MKNYCTLSALLMLTVLSSACIPATSPNSSSFSKTSATLKGYAFDVSELPVKDFEVVKLVFTRDILDETDKTPPLEAWHSLMIKAHEAKAHAIINVNIEESKACMELNANGDKAKHCTTTRYGSALAIRYTNTMTAGDNEFKYSVISGSSVKNTFNVKFENKEVRSDDNFTINTKEKNGQVIKGYTFDVNTLPMKDYEPVNIVFSRAIIDDSMNTPPSMLYHDLLVKAAAIGAHAVINVNMEETQVCETISRENGDHSQKCATVRYGAGLAIKYTKTIAASWEEVSADNYKKTISVAPKQEEQKPEEPREKKGGLLGLFGKGGK